MQNQHNCDNTPKNKTIFIVGQNSSLNKEDYDALRGLPTLGLDMCFGTWSSIGWRPSYYVCLNRDILQKHAKEIQEFISRNTDMVCFILKQSMLDHLSGLTNAPNVVIIEDYLNGNHFKGLEGSIYSGSASAMVAAMLGYKDIVLVDVSIAEHQAAECKEGANELSLLPYKCSGEDEETCFTIASIKEYQSWYIVKNKLASLGVSVVNCTVDSSLDMFVPVDIRKIKKDRKFSSEAVQQLDNFHKLLKIPAEVGGELLTIEGVQMPGKGRMTVTGNLKEVMKESISAAASYVRSRAVDFGIEPPRFDTSDIHVHVPEGATPKDGPSAGVAMATAIVSIMTGIPVSKDVAMTGEITLRGRVLPIGGLKEKLLAALRGGIKKVLIPEENAKDLAEIPDNVKNGLEIVPVSRMGEVLAHALVRKPEPIDWDPATAARTVAPVDGAEDGQAGLAH